MASSILQIRIYKELNKNYQAPAKMQSGANWCNLIQSDAIWCNLMQSGANWCNLVQTETCLLILRTCPERLGTKIQRFHIQLYLLQTEAIVSHKANKSANERLFTYFECK